MRIFISGGCKNGKSLHAQRLTKGMGEPLYYIATMLVKDAEDAERVKRHRAERDGWGFTTVEAPASLLKAIAECDPEGAFLLDSVTALLENAMFTADGMNPDAHYGVARELNAAITRLRNIVIVSDYIYSDAVIYTEPVERYRQGLAYIDRMAAEACDVVLEACCGRLITHKSSGAVL